MILPTLKYELDLWHQGYCAVAGLDEAGRGPLAGPLVAAAVILPPSFRANTLPGQIRDSKTLSAKQRETAAQRIYDVASAVGVGRVENTEIDELGITKSGQLAFQRALSKLVVKPDFYLVDAFMINDVDPNKQRAVIKGDQKIFTVVAASIIAKTARYKIMGEYSKEFPGYGFEKHKGYCTHDHLVAIQKLGPCPIHRLSFRPLK